ncbi:MAG: DUF565 domain-containing protein [Xenococcaceae cyanobacterium]
MQRTRLNTLVDLVGERIEQLFSNPWRRVSLILISLLFGIFMGEAISTTAGQAANWDVMVAGVLLLFTEMVSRFVYSRNQRVQPGVATRGSLFLDVLNVFKIGLVYSLFLEAFKLGS